MKSLSKSFLCISMLASIHILCAVKGDYSVDGNIFQLSRSNKKSDMRVLKATLVLSNKNRKQIVVDAWLDSTENHGTFFLVDEVYDTSLGLNFPLRNPYLIQISTSEQTLAYPLLFNDVVNVSCNENELVQRREVDNDRTLADEGSEIPEKYLITIEFDSANQKLSLPT